MKCCAVIRLYEDGDWVVTWHDYLNFTYTLEAVRGSTYRLEVDFTAPFPETFSGNGMPSIKETFSGRLRAKQGLMIITGVRW